MRLGIHLYTFGSLEGAARRAVDIGANTLQIFTASPRMWRARLPDRAEVEGLQRIRKQHGLRPLVVHVNYLVNLASRDPAIRANSIRTLRGEFERAAYVGAEYLVVHPGSSKGQTVDDAITAVAEGIRDSSTGLEDSGVTLLLENTAGSGSQLGSRFEELRTIRDRASDLTSLPLGYCLDTCHLWAAGFEITTASGLRFTLSQAGNFLGFANIPVLHVNDSKGGLGSHLDRHARIGEGLVGMEALSRILRHRKLRAKVFISETPVEGRYTEQYNMNTLRHAAGR